MTILSACAIRASLAYVSLLYAALTNNTLTLSANQFNSTCTDFPCAFATMTAGAITEYHWSIDAAIPIVRVESWSQICAADPTTAHSCVFDAVKSHPLVADFVCGVIIGAVEDDNETLVTARGIDGALAVIIVPHREFAATLGAIWTAQVADALGDKCESDPFTTAMKLLIAFVTLLSTVLSGLGVKSLVTCVQGRIAASKLAAGTTPAVELYLAK
jgi:hypothetical protein